MRKSGLITLLVLIGISLAIGYLLTDRLFESLIENYGSEAVGAKVEIDGFDFSLAGPDISWERLQITNPDNTMKNIFETARCEFKMEFWPLLSGKFVIENFQLSGLARNTIRETDGKIEKKKKDKGQKSTDALGDSSIAKTQKKLKKEKESALGFNLSDMGNFNTDSIMTLLDIRSPQLIDSAQKAMQENFNQWEKKLSGSDPQADVSRIERYISSIDVKEIKSVKSFEKALSSVKNVQGSIDSLNKAFKSARKEFSKDYDASGATLSNIDNWIEDDYKRAVSMAKLPDLSAQNIGKMLFGGQIVDQVYEYLGYVTMSRGYFNKINTGKDKEKSPPRFKGQDIYFATPNARPDFWLQNMSISGYLDEELPLGGSVTDITTDPKMIAKPVKIDINGSSKSRSYGLQGELNYLDSIPKEMFSANYKGMSLAGMELSQSELFPKSIMNGNGLFEIHFNMTGNRFNGKISFTGNNVNFAYISEKPSGKLATLIRDVFDQTKTLKVTSEIKGTADDLIFAVKSNLDDALSKAIKATANKEIEAARQKIRQKIDTQVAQKKAEADKIIRQNKEKIQQQLDTYQAQIDEQTKMLESKKKEVDKQKDKLGKKLKDTVKDLF